MSKSESATTETDLWPTADDPEPPEASEEGIALTNYIADFVRMVWARWRFVLCIVLAGILLSFVYAIRQPNIYTSTTTLMPPDQSSSYSGLMGMISGGSAAASFGAGELGLEAPDELYVSILSSRSVEDGVVAQLDLGKYFHLDDPATARGVLGGEVSAQSDHRTGIITITVHDLKPEMAAKIADAMVTQLNRVLSDNSTSSARRERIFLEGRVSEIKKDLDDTAQALSEFSGKNRTVDAASQARSMIDAGIRLQSELADARSQLAALRQVYSEDNSRVKSLQARISELQQEVDAMSGQPGGGKGAASNASYPSAAQLSTLGVTYYDLQRKMMVQEAIWEALAKQYESAKVEEVKSMPTVRVLDAANIPKSKSGPVRSMIMIVGTLVSFAVACLLVVGLKFWEQMDREAEPKKLILEIVAGVKKTLGVVRRPNASANS
jgi:uncharacterized protein involved in exopolysaccharide biosynthesis